MINAIVAMAENRVIGKNNQLPWHLPADLAHFKKITSGHTIIMGRKTYESIGKPLPNRINKVITRNNNYSAPGCQIFSSLDDALGEDRSEEIFIIGGAQLFAQALPLVQRLYLTIIHQDFEGDTFFPELKGEEWQVISEEKHTPDEKNAYAYRFLTLDRV